MVSADAIRTVVGIMGNFTALTLALSPVKTFVRIWKKGSVEQYSPVPYLATLFNCMAWVLYGLPMVHPHSILLVTINSTGVFIELSFIILFLIYASDKKQRLKVLLVLLLELVFMVLLAFLVIKLAQTYSTRSLIVGLVCVLGNIVMYASPLSVMGVVEAQSRQYRATVESSMGCGGGPGRDVTIWYQSQSLAGSVPTRTLGPLRGVDCKIPHHPREWIL